MMNPPVPPEPSFDLLPEPSFDLTPQPLNLPPGWRIASVNIEPIPESYSVITAIPIPADAPAPNFAVNQRVIWLDRRVRNTARVVGIVWSKQNNVEGYYYLILPDELTPAFAKGIRGIWVFEKSLTSIEVTELLDLIEELRRLQ